MPGHRRVGFGRAGDHHEEQHHVVGLRRKRGAIRLGTPPLEAVPQTRVRAKGPCRTGAHDDLMQLYDAIVMFRLCSGRKQLHLSGDCKLCERVRLLRCRCGRSRCGGACQL